jgi:hypothetical protein
MTGNMERLKLLVEPLAAITSHWLDLHGMQHDQRLAEPTTRAFQVPTVPGSPWSTRIRAQYCAWLMFLEAEQARPAQSECALSGGPRFAVGPLLG